MVTAPMHQRLVDAPRSRWLVFGLGKTGLSCCRFLASRGQVVRAVDTRESPPARDVLMRELPGIELAHDSAGVRLLDGIDKVLLSPGVPHTHPLVADARARGLPIVGDITLFAAHASAPYVAITGSNGKSTVTTLVAEILAEEGYRVKAGANLGTPALELLQGPVPDWFVLELSSFQLEVTDGLAARAACVLNITPDHLDRHGTLDAYAAAKFRILAGAQEAVLNADDPIVMRAGVGLPVRWVSLAGAASATYTVREHAGARMLCNGDETVLPSADLAIRGTHNEFNALAAIALTDTIGVSRRAQCAVLRRFRGLAHRCALVVEHAGVAWFNDSKGTNVGASAAAIAGIFARRRGVLIAGGQGKGADFLALRDAVAGRVHTVVVLGEDGPLIAAAIGDLVRIEAAGSMREAVEIAANRAETGDAVLLSPACASLDMFQNYEARGQAFEAAVREQVRP